MPPGTLSYLVPPAHGLEVSVFVEGTTTVVVLRGVTLRSPSRIARRLLEVFGLWYPVTTAAA